LRWQRRGRADLTTAGYVVKHKHGRRNRYQIQAHLPLPEPASREPAIGDVLAMLAGDAAGPELPGSAPGDGVEVAEGLGVGAGQAGLAVGQAVLFAECPD